MIWCSGRSIRERWDPVLRLLFALPQFLLIPIPLLVAVSLSLFSGMHEAGEDIPLLIASRQVSGAEIIICLVWASSLYLGGRLHLGAAAERGWRWMLAAWLVGVVFLCIAQPVTDHRF